MGLLAIILLGIGLSLDAFAVSLSIGFAGEKLPHRNKVRFLIVIGFMHLLMIFLGWVFGENASHIIAEYDHWIAFSLLAAVGGKMIKEGLEPNSEQEDQCDLLSLRNTMMLGVALSIDALITGFSLGLVKITVIEGSQLSNTLISGVIIGSLAFLISAIGIKIGQKASGCLGAKAEIFGGLILILIGIKVLIEHI